ncbi:CPBP family intramembrane glutamic endopeptidase [Lacibacter sediminis]|uniref:CPBP family intramembrane metalloprotease n=1 Tax=Lacibacter sediminis TaxID=2760713 RepID=A0A7G5XHA4_9BACT|nr:CPBP family intramembrane glutamic endopeptidase [Lacibacter sediminis]QNA44857.1 CPBP family intramembrane metalloprotease [Lacibacter sediminis]
MKKLFATTVADLLQPAMFKKYAISFLLIAVVCFLNYYTSVSFWLRNVPFNYAFIWYSLLFFFFFTAGFLIQNGTALFQKKQVQFILIAAPILFALKVSLPFHKLLSSTVGGHYQKAFQQPMNWFGALLIVLPLLMLVHWLLEKKWTLYGIKQTQSLKTYVLLIAVMLPLLVWASLQHDFSLVYPKAAIVGRQLGDAANPFHYLLFETAYAADFFTIEFFFRGFLIIALSKLIGKQCLLPVALFYFSIHLGKPMMEAVSSFFGGLILGSISYHSKSIWGGLLVHISIALLMELFGFIF